jgi:phage host-nuclease inhibitor protein Gam
MTMQWKEAYKLFSAVPVATVEINDQTSAVKTASPLKRLKALNVLVAGLVEHVQDFGRGRTDGSTGNGTHRLGNVVMGRIEEDQQPSKLVDGVNGPRLVQMSLSQSLHHRQSSLRD